MQGNFITFEGVEGAGKSTILHLSAEYLLKEGFEVMTTREPGGIQLAEAIRAIILDRKNTHMDGRTEALLYAAARRQHLVEKVLPALAAGKLVLCDRFVDSSLAYQGYARGIGLEEVWEINRFAIEGCLPKLTIYFDLDPEIGLQRINNNQGREINRLDLETVDFHQRVREGYLYLTKHFPERMVLIDASGTIPQVFARVKSILQKRFLKS